MLNVGDKAPALLLEDQNGETVSLEHFKGKKVLIWFQLHFKKAKSFFLKKTVMLRKLMTQK